MIETAPSKLERRVAVWGPGVRDAALIRDVLTREGVDTVLCPDADCLMDALEAGAGAVVVDEEAITRDGRRLEWFLRRQPAWSDLPVLLLTSTGADSATVMHAIETLGNVTILERPARVTALVTGVLAALRSRVRQYQIRAHLTEQAWSERLRSTEVAVARILARESVDAPTIEMLRAVVEGLAWEAGGVWLVREDRISNAAFWSSSARPRFEAATRSRTFALGEGLPGRVLASGEPAWISDIAQDLNFPRREPAAAEGLRGAFAFPIRRFHEIVAVVELFSPEPRVPDAALVATMSTIGSQIGRSLERRHTEEVLREADRRKDEFLATLAHELRNPLAPIRSAEQILSSPEVGEADARWARDVIERQVGHLSRLVEDLMDVSRIASGKIVLRRERVELRSVIETAVETSRPLLDGADQQFVATGVERSLFIDADPIRLSQVVSNLLNNASKFTPREGVVRLDVGKEGRTLVLTVSDTGIGIPGPMLETVFDLFSQAERPRDGVRGGLGIGLTLVRSFVQLHGGSVEARSEGLGRGSQFVIRLPVIVEAGAAARRAPAEKPPSRSLRIVVADDNVDSADGLAKLLRLDGHEVATANTGSAAVSAVQSFHPELVLLDIGLPDISGYDAARQIRALPGGSALRLVAVTGWGQHEDRRRSKEAGFDRHLVKPVDAAKLEKVILDVGGRTGDPRPS